MRSGLRLAIAFAAIVVFCGGCGPIKVPPRDNDLLFKQAWSLEDSGRQQEALAELKRIAEAESSNPEAAAKALSLASGGAEYFSASINAAARLTTAERKKVDATLARSQRAVDSLLRGRSAVLTASQVEQLSAIWTGLWKAIDASVRPTVRLLVRQLPVR